MIDEDDKTPVVAMERPAGLLRIAFVDQGEVLVSSENYTVNRVDYRLTIRFKYEAGAWVDARDVWIRRAQYRRDDHPSDSARRKIREDAEAALREALKHDPEILVRAGATRLRRDIARKHEELAAAEKKSATIRDEVHALTDELATLVSAVPPGAAPESRD